MGEVRCFKCSAAVAPTETTCPACHHQVAASDASTVVETAATVHVESAPPRPRPDPDAVPSWRRKVLLAVGGCALLPLLLAAALGRVDRTETIDRWTSELAGELANPRSAFRLQPDDHAAESGTVIYVGEASDLALFERVPLPPRFTRAHAIRYSALEFLRERSPPTAHYVVTIVGPFPLSFGAALYATSPGGPAILTFEYRKWSFLVARWAGWLMLLIPLTVVAIDRTLIHRFRSAQRRSYESYERERTALYHRAREHIVNARVLVEAGELAKALVAADEALALLPEYSEALELRRLILRRAAEEASVTAIDFAPPAVEREEVLYLRVVGTPYAYRAEPGAATIRIGRQRPRPGDAKADHNDLVIRVPASDDRTLRISRRHFEITRIGREYFVVDHSGGQTQLNGRALVLDRPAKLVSGDRLLVADVMTLEVSVRPALPGSGARIVQVGRDAARVDMEATVGDMMTEA